MLLFLSFVPFSGHWLLSLFAFSFLFRSLSAQGADPKRFWLLGIIFWALALYWIPPTLNSYGDTGWPLALVAYCALVFYLSLFFLVWGLACRRGLWMGVFSYVLLEWLRVKLIYGFPFFVLAHSLADFPFLIQEASIFGQWGVSFKILSVNAALATKRRSFILVALLFLIIDAFLWFSGGRMSSPVSVALVQPNLGEKEKWDPSMRERNVALVIDMIKEACGRGVDLVVAPETTFPFYWGIDKDTQRVLNETSSCSSHILAGVITYTYKGEKPYFLNRAVLLRRGRIEGSYDKRILVPFGEFIPLRSLLERVLPIYLPMDFARGNAPPLIPMGNRKFLCGICYEMSFPGYVDGYAGEADFLVNITNDMWFGRTIAPYVHFWSSVLRAVETGRFLFRCANSGISAVVDPKGRVLKKTPIFERKILVYAGD